MGVMQQISGGTRPTQAAKIALLIESPQLPNQILAKSMDLMGLAEHHRFKDQSWKSMDRVRPDTDSLGTVKVGVQQVMDTPIKATECLFPLRTHLLWRELRGGQ